VPRHSSENPRYPDGEASGEGATPQFFLDDERYVADHPTFRLKLKTPTGNAKQRPSAKERYYVRFPAAARLRDSED
jgi:hypothetical protein